MSKRGGPLFWWRDGTRRGIDPQQDTAPDGDRALYVAAQMAGVLGVVPVQPGEEIAFRAADSVSADDAALFIANALAAGESAIPVSPSGVLSFFVVASLMTKSFLASSYVHIGRMSTSPRRLCSGSHNRILYGRGSSCPPALTPRSPTFPWRCTPASIEAVWCSVADGETAAARAQHLGRRFERRVTYAPQRRCDCCSPLFPFLTLCV